MDYEAEIDELKRAVAALQEQVRLLLQSHPRHKIPVTVAAESTWRDGCILPAGLSMIRRDDGKFVPCGDDQKPFGQLANTIRMQTFDGVAEDKLAALELMP